MQFTCIFQKVFVNLFVLFKQIGMPVKFYLHPKTNKHGEAPITFSANVRHTRLLTTLGYSVDPSAWDESGSVKPRYTNSKGIPARKINNRILKIKLHFAEYESELKTRPTNEELKEQFNIAISLGDDLVQNEVEKEAPAKSIYLYLDEFIKEESVLNQWAHATVQCWNTFKNHLLSFGKRLEFRDFNEKGLSRFVMHLRKTRKLEEKTVQKHYSNLKWFLNWAIRKGYCDEEAVNKFRPKFKVLDKPVIFLTKEELLKLYTYEIPKNGTKVKLYDANGEEYEKTVQEAGALAKTRDLFCFCAFTSLRYSDMASLKRTDIDGDKIYITTQKTNDRLPIDLSKNAKAILEKYENEQFPFGLALPVISNQKMNHYLKDLGELCGFTTPVTIVCYRAGQRVEETYPKYSLIGTHAARRTFICFALSNGVPPQVVMKWTGHSDYKAMRPYIDIAEKTKADAMKQIDDAWGM